MFHSAGCIRRDGQRERTSEEGRGAVSRSPAHLGGAAFIHHRPCPLHVCSRPVREPSPQPRVYLHLISHLFLLVRLSSLQFLGPSPRAALKVAWLPAPPRLPVSQGSWTRERGPMEPLRHP